MPTPKNDINKVKKDTNHYPEFLNYLCKTQNILIPNNKDYQNICYQQLSKIFINDFGEDLNSDILNDIKILIKRNDKSANLYRQFVDTIYRAIYICFGEDSLKNYINYNYKEFKKCLNFSAFEILKSNNKNTINLLNNICGGLPKSVFSDYLNKMDVIYELNFSDGKKFNIFINKTTFNLPYHNSMDIICDILKIKKNENNNYDFHLYKLLYCIKENSESKYIKLCDYIKNNFKNEKFWQVCFNNNYNLYFCNEENVLNTILSEFIGRFAITFKKSNMDIAKSLLTNENKNDLLYPIKKVNNFESKTKIGKDIFEKFLYEIYGEQNFNKILEIFNNLELNISNENLKLKIKNVLNFSNIYIQYAYDKSYDFIDDFYPEFLDEKYTKDRLYILCYILYEHWNDNMISLLFNRFYWVFDSIEKKFGIIPKHKNNIEQEEKTLKSLKTKLKKYNIDIGENFKDNYLISLMDYDYATMEQREKFAYLEQLGDAIYEVALQNIIIHNIDLYKDYIISECNGKNNYLSYYIEIKKNQYVTAKVQLKIAKKLGIDKLYMQSGYNSYCDNNFTERYIINHSKDYINEDSKAYLSDSYEMIIGSVCIEHGVEKALEFARNTILESYPELLKNIIVNDSNKLKQLDLNFLKEKNEEDFCLNEINDYYQKKDVIYEFFKTIDPSLCSIIWDKDNEFYSRYSSIGNSLYKLSKLLVWENDTKDKRIQLNTIYLTDKDLGLKMCYYFLKYGFNVMLEKTKNLIQIK